MPNMMDDNTENAFKMILDIDADVLENLAAERAATAVMVEKLESKFADRGLKFTAPFYGAMPVQAFGHLDGLRFYFRFRHNHARLRLGPYDVEIEELKALREKESLIQNLEKLEQSYLDEEISQNDYEMSKRLLDHKTSYAGVTEEEETQFSPTLIAKVASTSGPEHEGQDNSYNGFLTNDEAFEIFSTLVAKLEDVPEDKQLSEMDRIWLYEGLDASKAYFENQQEMWRKKFDGKTEDEMRAILDETQK